MPRWEPRFLFNVDLPKGKRAAVYLAPPAFLGSDRGMCTLFKRKKGCIDFKIYIRSNLGKRERREILLHELGHALDWKKPEKRVAEEAEIASRAIDLLEATCRKLR